MADHEDLAANKTEGFKIGEKKTLQEYQQLGMSHDLFLSFRDLAYAAFCLFSLPCGHRTRFPLQLNVTTDHYLHSELANIYLLLDSFPPHI